MPTHLSSHAVLLDTAHEALAKKLHTVRKGYYADPFAHFFAHDETVVNSPLMNHGQWLRVKALEYAVAQFAQRHSPNPVQVLNIGAGMDTLFFRWASSNKLDPVEAPLVNISRWVETDLPEMITNKQHRISRAPPLKDLVEQRKDVYKLVATDITNIDAFTKALADNLDPRLPTFVAAEFVFVYFPAQTTNELLTRLLSDVFRDNDDVALFSLDAINPTSRFGRVMTENLAAREIFLAGIDDLPTTQSHEDRLIKVGFKAAKSQTLGQLHKTVPQAQLAALNRIEMVDDWDEWEMVMAHYCVSVASKRADCLPQIFDHLPPTHCIEVPAPHRSHDRLASSSSSNH